MEEAGRAGVCLSLTYLPPLPTLRRLGTKEEGSLGSREGKWEREREKKRGGGKRGSIVGGLYCIVSEADDFTVL